MAFVCSISTRRMRFRRIFPLCSCSAPRGIARNHCKIAPAAKYAARALQVAARAGPLFSVTRRSLFHPGTFPEQGAGKGHACGGCLFLSGALGMELVGAKCASNCGLDSLGYDWCVTVEESLEMVGVALFIRTLLLYLEATFGACAISFGRDTKPPTAQDVPGNAGPSEVFDSPVRGPIRFAGRCLGRNTSWFISHPLPDERPAGQQSRRRGPRPASAGAPAGESRPARPRSWAKENRGKILHPARSSARNPAQKIRSPPRPLRPVFLLPTHP